MGMSYILTVPTATPMAYIVACPDPELLAALNLLRTIQGKPETDVSIGLLRDRIGRQSWILAAALP